MADPAMAAARDEAERLGTIVGSDVDRIEDALLRETAGEEPHVVGLLEALEASLAAIRAHRPTSAG